MLQTVYSYFIYPILELIFLIATLVNKKASRTHKGRKYQDSRLLEFANIHKNNSKIILFHSASVGEFEQAKPIIEKIKTEIPNTIIVATFFSVSGYEQQKNFPLLDFAFFLPPDTRTKTKAFLQIIQPDVILIMRYDLWLQFLTQAKEMNIPVMLANATLQANSMKFLPIIKSFFRHLYSLVDTIYCVSENDKTAFNKLLGQNSDKVQSDKIQIAGDSRYDQVIAKANSKIENNVIPTNLLDNKFVIVAGSTWKPDETLLAGLFGNYDNHFYSKLNEQNKIAIKDILLVIVPHEPTEQNINFIKNIFPTSLNSNELKNSYSNRTTSEGEIFFKNNGIKKIQITTVVVPKTGILSGLYGIADLAYVGGGFGVGVHSTLEPAAFGLPVVCGKNINRSQDATYLRAGGVLSVVTNKTDLANVLLDLMSNEIHRQEICSKSRQMVLEKAGTSDIILSKCKEILDK